MTDFDAVRRKLPTMVEAGEVSAALDLLGCHSELATAPLDPPSALVHQQDYVVHYLSASNGAGTVLERALALGANPNTRGYNGGTPLHRAAWNGHVEAMEILLAHGADLEARDDQGHTPLDLTYHARDSAGRDFLLSRGAKPGIIPPLVYERLASVAQFEKAIAAKDVPAALKLLDRHPELATAPLDPPLDLPPGIIVQQSFVIHLLAGSPGVVPVLERVLALGADPNTRGENGHTPLHEAAWDGIVEAMEILLAHGAELEVRTEFGYTPLDLTYHAHDPAGHDFLLSRGAKPGLLPALKYDRLDLLDLLGRSVNPAAVLDRARDTGLLFLFADFGPHADYKVHILQRLGLNPAEGGTEHRETLLLDAVEDQNVDKALWLLNLEPGLTTRSVGVFDDGDDDFRRVPLVYLLASRPGVVPVLERAIALGAKVGDRDPDGRTPLHAASWDGNVEAMPVLLSHGADLEAKDTEGLTPLDLTYHADDPAGLDFLLARGGTPGLLPLLAYDRLDLLEDLILHQTWDALRCRVPDLNLLWELAGEGPRAAEKLAILDRLGVK